MIISFIYNVALSKFVDSSFPQLNVHTGVQGGCLAFTPLDGYPKLWELQPDNVKLNNDMVFGDNTKILKDVVSHAVT